MSQDFSDFFTKYCDFPPEYITEDDVIAHFVKYIKTTCTKTENIIEYTFPSEFKGKIKIEDFWSYIINFLEQKMSFKRIQISYSEQVVVPTSQAYNKIPFKCYACMKLIPNVFYPGKIQYQTCKDLELLHHIVFRIYKKE
jgi:hypothetical protein